jgi:hypothetical protein
MKHTPYSVTPRPRDRASVVLLAVCMAGALAAFFLASLLSAYQAVLQAVGFVALVGAVYIIVRTRTPYVYTVEDDLQAPGESDLVIVRLHGKQRVTACRLAMRDIRRIDEVTPDNRRALREQYRDKTVHNYCPTLFPEVSLYLTFEDSDPYAPDPTEDERSHPAKEVILYVAHDPTLLAMLREELRRH